MEDRYSRNNLYVSKDEQAYIKNYPILLAGSGIGSNIAECALRFGFENITIIDGDTVELTNLNRQNYIDEDISKYKSDVLYHRLKSINPTANIKHINTFITDDNLAKIIDGHKIAVNALDFSSNIPLIFDKACQKRDIFVLHPYNIGWGGLVTVITPDGLPLNSLTDNEDFNELKMVEYVAGYLRFWEKPNDWLEKIIHDYKNKSSAMSPPQLAIASWIVAGMCTHIMFNIATNKSFKKFPQFYITSISD